MIFETVPGTGGRDKRLASSAEAQDNIRPPVDKQNRYDSFARTLPTFQGSSHENIRISVLSIAFM